MLRVKELMTGDVKTCRPQDALAEAARIMWHHDCGAVPVVDQDSQVVGMITDRDLAMAAFLQARSLHESVVSTAMSRTIYSCRPEDSVADAEKLMRDHQVRRLPVVDAHNRVVGLLSLNDLALAGAIERGKLPLDEVGATLAGICKPPLPAARPAVEAVVKTAPQPTRTMKRRS